MKKSLSALCLVAAICAPLSALASDGTINFNGALTATTCTVTSGGATALSVGLPTLATTAPSPTAGDTSFALTISGCTGPTTTATTYFEAGPTINTASGRLFNTAAGGPANIELQLLNGTGSTINLAGGPPTSTTSPQGVAAAAVSGGSATANFIVRYYHTDTTTVAAGAVTSSVTYSMVYTVLVEGDDMTEPVADETRSILDGHIVLSRKLGSANHYPAIDVLASASRVMNALITPEHKAAAGRVRELMAKYEDIELLVKVGEYKKGSDPVADIALEKHEAIREFLRQDTDEHMDFDETIERLRALAM